jgi:hypothetical protein
MGSMSWMSASSLLRAGVEDDAHLKNSIIKDESLFHSASVTNLYIGTNRNIGADLGSRIYVGCLVDEARLDNCRSTALVSGS